VVPAGEILIQQGDTGRSAAELYIVKTGVFEVCAFRLFSVIFGCLVICVFIGQHAKAAACAQVGARS
jgi:hypothetical protein